MFSIENRRALIFAAYCLGGAFVGEEILILVFSAFKSLEPDWDPAFLTGHLWIVLRAAVAATLAFTLWQVVGPSPSRARRGLSPIVLGALSGWLMQVLFGFGLLILIWRAPELPAFMTGFWPAFMLIVMSPTNWTGLAFGALAGWIYEASIGRDGLGNDARTQVPISHRAASAVMTVATPISLFAASFLILRYLSSWDAMFSYWYRARTLTAATAVLLLLVLPALSWWLFTRRQNAAGLIVALISVVLAAVVTWLRL